MPKQQNYWFTKQDVVKAQEILTAVQERNIKAIYTIVSLPDAMQKKLTDKTPVDAEKILTTQLSDLKKSYATDEKKYKNIDPKKPKALKALCEKLDTEKKESEQVQKCLDLIHAINDTSISIKQILESSEVSRHLIEKLDLNYKYTTIPMVVTLLEELLSTFNDPLSESDFGYTSDDVLSKSTSETDNASSDDVFRSNKCTVKSPSTNTYQRGPQLSKLVMNELHQKIQNSNAAPTDNHIDEVNTVGEHHDTH
jgi:hypothetical protein